MRLGVNQEAGFYFVCDDQSWEDFIQECTGGGVPKGTSLPCD